MRYRYAMPNYRIYKLSADNHIVGVSEVIECESDSEAITRATKKLDGSRPGALAVTSE